MHERGLSADDMPSVPYRDWCTQYPVIKEKYNYEPDKHVIVNTCPAVSGILNYKKYLDFR